MMRHSASPLAIAAVLAMGLTTGTTGTTARAQGLEAAANPEAATPEADEPVLLDPLPANEEQALAVEAGDEVMVLDAIDVYGVPVAPAGATPREIIGRAEIGRYPDRSAADLFDGVTGVTGLNNPTNPGITVNVRGVQDRTRVTTMIDGARQNFQQSGHGVSQLTYVDPNLLREVVIDKAVEADVGGAGSLAGSVDFRTIEAGDFLEGPEDSLAGELRGGAGTNAEYFNGSAALAARPTEWLQTVVAVSRRRLGEYDVGKNGKLRLSGTALPGAEPVRFSGSSTWTGLGKAQVEVNEDLDLTFSYLQMDTKFETGSLSSVDSQDTVNRTAVAAAHWTPGERHDIDARIWWNGLTNDQDRVARDNYDGFRLDYELNTYGGSVRDAMHFATAYGKLDLSFGAEGFWDDSSSSQLASNPSDDPDGVWFVGSNPAGDRGVAGAFGHATLAPTDWLHLRAGLRVDGYQMDGTASVYGSDLTPTDGRYYDMKVDQSDMAVLPSAGISVLPAQGLEIFANYTTSWRPPTLPESVFGGSHIGFNLYFSPNPFLKPETSQMFELGAAWETWGLLTPDDGLRLRASVYNRNIYDMIVSADINGPIPGTGYKHEYVAYVNLDGRSNIQGVEVQADYAVDRFDFGLSLEFMDQDLRGSYDATPYGPKPTRIKANPSLTQPPPVQLTLRAQGRFLDDRLEVGGRMRHVGQAYDSLSAYALDTFTVFDAWARLRVVDTVWLNAAVTNITDLAYVDSLGSAGFPAPGRTFSLSLEARF